MPWTSESFNLLTIWTFDYYLSNRLSWGWDGVSFLPHLSNSIALALHLSIDRSRTMISIDCSIPSQYRELLKFTLDLGSVMSYELWVAISSHFIYFYYGVYYGVFFFLCAQLQILSAAASTNSFTDGEQQTQWSFTLISIIIIRFVVFAFSSFYNIVHWRLFYFISIRMYFVSLESFHRMNKITKTSVWFVPWCRSKIDRK